MRLIILFALLGSSCFASSLPNNISFKENKGQVHDQNNNVRRDILFSGMAGPMAFHLKNNGISYQLYKTLSWKEIEDPKNHTPLKTKVSDNISIYRVDINWMNANSNNSIVKDNVLDGYDNYYNEACPNGAHNIKTFSGLTYKNIYNGIDLHYYSKEGQLKYDYLVEANTDYKQIQLQIEGAEHIEINKNGELVIKTPLGNITEGSPLVFQNDKQLESRWILNDNTLSFEIKNYNPLLSLIIDPLTRAWGTYYGGAGADQGSSVSTDLSGNVYLAGNTDSNTGTIIATTGSHQTTFAGGTDVYLTKFNSSGVRQWGTYYGGSGDDRTYSSVSDASGNIYIGGLTNSNSGNAIASIGSHQSTNGGGYDAFLVKFNSLGVRQWGTYYGTSGAENGWSCATDPSGNVYLCGDTDLSMGTGTVIATTGSHQPASGGWIDGFIVKFNSAGVRQWGTYYGDNGMENAFGVATDLSGNVYLTGRSDSNLGTAIATVGSYQQVNAGFIDVFLAKFRPLGVRQWGTYYGGSSNEEALTCIADQIGNIYLIGWSISTNGVATSGAYQTTYAGGLRDGFLAKFNSSGSIQWGTYYGINGNDAPYSCLIDATNNIIISGFADATGFATAGSYQPNYGGGSYDGYITLFDPTGVVQWSTYYGDIGMDFIRGSCIDIMGNIFVTGITDTNTGTVVASGGSHQSSNGGGTSDGFLVKFNSLTANVNESGNIIESPIYVFPNPTTNEFTISLKQLNENTTIEIYNTIGQQIIKQKITEEETKINLKDQANGIYFVKVTGDGKTIYHSKVIKQ